MAASERDPVLHHYGRTSHPDQRKGGGLARQTGADVSEFARQYGFKVSKKIWVDDGVSAFKGLHRSPDHELGKFLAEARRGLIPPGDCLLIENWDRLRRQDVWAATGLVSELRELKIHVGRLDRMKLLRYDSEAPGDFFEAAVELMRGHSESAAKSMRNGDAWKKKRKAAREGRAVLTHRLPAWVEEHGGKLRLIPERALVVQRIFALAAGGYGHASIVKRLTAEKVPAFGAREVVCDEKGEIVRTKKGRVRVKGIEGESFGSGAWTRSYVANILKDRRTLGELQPRMRDGTPDGKAIANYFPAVVTEDQWHAARGGANQRRQKPGRIGEHVNVFAGLLRNARDGDSYYVATRTDGHKPGRRGGTHRVLINTASAEGRAKCHSFPFATFEAAVLQLLREIDPHDILNGDQGPDDTLALSGELATVEAKLAELETELRTGNVAILANVARQLEGRKRELADRLAEAREKAAHPLSESWGEAQSLLSAIHDAPDPMDARLRLRAALRRIVESIWLLVVPRGRDRLAAVQVWFVGGERHRDYLILHQSAKANGKARRDGQWWVRSLATAAAPKDLDLRKPADAKKLEAALATAELGEGPE